MLYFCDYCEESFDDECLNADELELFNDYETCPLCGHESMFCEIYREEEDFEQDIIMYFMNRTASHY